MNVITIHVLILEKNPQKWLDGVNETFLFYFSVFSFSFTDVTFQAFSTTVLSIIQMNVMSLFALKMI